MRNTRMHEKEQENCSWGPILIIKDPPKLCRACALHTDRVMHGSSGDGHICLPLCTGIQGKQKVRGVEAAPPALTCSTDAVCIWDDRGLGLTVSSFWKLAFGSWQLSINSTLLFLTLWALWQLVPDDMMPQKNSPILTLYAAAGVAFLLKATSKHSLLIL